MSIHEKRIIARIYQNSIYIINLFIWQIDRRIFMYYFLNLDEQTRLNMISELEFDIRTGLFYEPLSMTTSGMMTYKRLLKECFEKGTPETLQQKLSSSFFREKDRNGRKVPSNIRETVAFSDFNRYYVRALLLRALSENKKLCVYRAKQVMNERKESRSLVNKVYFDKRQIGQMLELFRDYRKLFSSQHELLKPNSGLSLRLVG